VRSDAEASERARSRPAGAEAEHPEIAAEVQIKSAETKVVGWTSHHSRSTEHQSKLPRGAKVRECLPQAGQGLELGGSTAVSPLGSRQDMSVQWSAPEVSLT